MTVPDSVLAKEYSLVMERAYAFEPINGDLTKWRGFIPAISDEGEILVEVEIYLTDAFPETPPQVKIITPITHPNLTHDNYLEMRMLARWRSSYHLFQVIVETIRLFSKVPARLIKAEAEAIDPQNQLTPLTNQKDQLSIILEEKKRELNEISTKKPGQVSSKTLQKEKQKHIEDEVLNVENELFAVEQQFEDYEISSIEFAKKFYILKKRLFLLEAQS
jgi:ubiquitin-protein ligase